MDKPCRAWHKSTYLAAFPLRVNLFRAWHDSFLIPGMFPFKRQALPCVFYEPSCWRYFLLFSASLLHHLRAKCATVTCFTGNFVGQRDMAEAPRPAPVIVHHAFDNYLPFMAIKARLLMQPSAVNWLALNHALSYARPPPFFFSFCLEVRDM